MNRTIHGARVALLEIGTPAAPDQQGVAGKGHGLVIQYIGDATVRMTRGFAHLEITRPEADVVAVG